MVTTQFIQENQAKFLFTRQNRSYTPTFYLSTTHTRSQPINFAAFTTRPPKKQGCFFSETAPFIISKIQSYFFEFTFFIMNKKPTTKATPIAKQIQAFWI